MISEKQNPQLDADAHEEPRDLAEETPYTEANRKKAMDDADGKYHIPIIKTPDALI